MSDIATDGNDAIDLREDYGRRHDVDLRTVSRTRIDLERLDREERAERETATIAVLREAVLDQARPLAPPHPPTPWPAWVRALDAVHSCRRHVLVALVDGLVAAAVCYAIGLSLAVSLGGAALLLLCSYVAGVYAFRDSVQTQGVLWYPSTALAPIAVAALIGCAAGVTPASTVVGAAGAVTATLIGLRSLTWAALSEARLRGLGLRGTLLVGGERESAVLWRKLHQFPEAGLRAIEHLPAEILGESGRLSREVIRTQAQHVIVLPGEGEGAALAASLLRSDGLPTTLSLVPPLAEVFLAGQAVNELGGVPLIPLGRALQGRTSYPGKRAVDVAGSALLLVLAAPVMALAAFLVKREDGGPAFFRQERTGRHNELFSMIKLRSMQTDAEAGRATLSDANVTDGLLFKVAGDPRITRVGRWLRSTSIDELPQLWNVLRGDMSLVGPRPLPRRAEEFRPDEAGRHSVRPGITGYWQISGGNGLSYDEMVRLDLSYVHTWSLWLDVRLLMRTPSALIRRKGPA